MLDRIASLSTSLSGVLPETSFSTQTNMAIPTGIVRSRCQAFEARISAHQYEHDSVYICRAARNVTELIRRSTTYAEQLQSAENATLFDLPEHLVDFLRVHDDLYRAAVRNRQAARKVRASQSMTVTKRVAIRLRNIRTAYYINLVEASYSDAEQERLMHDPEIAKEFTESTQLLQNEFVLQLTNLERLGLLLNKDVELENIGPDHNVDDFGHDLPCPTPTSFTSSLNPTHRCCICLCPWTPTHRAFHITACAHTIGKPCLARWLNSTAANAHRCPQCRTPLCERRARRPKTTTSVAAASDEHRAVCMRMARVIVELEQAARLQGELFGPARERELVVGVVEEINYRLFEGDLGFCLVWEGVGGDWGVRRVTWH